MRFLLLELILADHLVKNGNIRSSTVRAPSSRYLPGQEWQFHIATVRAHILAELILADHLADLPPPLVEVSSGQEWQYEICTVRAHICRTLLADMQYHHT